MSGGQDKQGEKRPVLQSSEALKGKKAAPKKSVAKWMALLALALVLGGAWAVYTFTDVLKKPTQALPTPAPSTAVKLIDRQKSDFDRVAITNANGERYTVISNLAYDAEGNIIRETPAPASESATPAPEITASPAPISSTETTQPIDEPASGPVIIEPVLDQEYEIEGQPYFAVSVSPVASMHTSAVSLSALDTAMQDAKDLSIFGLEDPSLTVAIGYRDGTGSTIHFGDKTPLGSSYYARLDDSNTVYTVGSTTYNTFGKSLSQLHVVSLPATVDPNAVASLLIEQPGKDVIEIRQILDDTSASISTLKLVQPIEYDAHMTRSSEMATAVGSVTLSGYAGHARTQEELETYGLGQPRAHVRFEDSGANVLDLLIGAQMDELYSYVMVDQTGDVYMIENALIGFLDNATVAYLVDQFSNLVDITKVDTLTVSTPDQRYVLSIERQQVAKEDGTTESVDTYLFDGAPAEEKLFKGLYIEIIGILFDKMKQDELPLGSVVTSVHYQLNNGREDILVEYLEYDKDYYAIRQDGKVMFLIKHGKVNAMIEKCQQFRDGTFVRS